MLSTLKQKISDLLSFFKKNDDLIIAPCVGDIVEYEDGARAMVASVLVIDDKYDVRFFKEPVRCLNQKGRQKTTIEISKKCEIWPPQDSKIFRDSMMIYPMKNWKISFINWLSKKLLK